ncbi:hypothetical protein MRX96_056002 [Rhipicephalus microplus]
MARSHLTTAPWPAPGGTSAALSSSFEGGFGWFEWDETRCLHAVTQRTPAPVFHRFLGRFRCSNGRLKATMLVDTVDGRARSAQTGMLRRQVDLRTRTVPPHDPRAAEASRPAMT